MKMTLPLLFLIIAFSTTGIAADSSWLNNKWEPCLKEKASFYTITVKKDMLWEQQMYYTNTNMLFMNGCFKDANCTIKTGIFIWYHPNGTMSDSITYEQGKPRYLSHYHANGKLKTVLIYNEMNRAIFVNSWTIEGNETYTDTFYHDRHHGECHKDTAYLKGIITKEDSLWHLKFYYTTNNSLYINSYYKQRLCVTRVGHFERYNEEGKIMDSCLYYDNGKKQAQWLFRNNCMMSAYKTYDTAGIVTGGAYWDEVGNERIINPNIKYPYQPGGFQPWKKRVITRINNDNSITWSTRREYYGSIRVKLHIDRDGKLTNGFISHSSGFPDMDSLVLATCMIYKSWIPGTIRGKKASFIINCNFYLTAGMVTGYQQTY